MSGKVWVYENEKIFRDKNTNIGIIVTPNQKAVYKDVNRILEAKLIDMPILIIPENVNKDKSENIKLLNFNFENSNIAAVLKSIELNYGINIKATNENVLRGEWNYKGMIVSDYDGISQLFEKHHVANDKKEAAMKAFNSGVQAEFPRSVYYQFLPELVKEGKVKLADLDSAVFKVLQLKFQMGLFENPYVDIANAIAVSKEPASRSLALKSAQESIVLLKNENNILPLQKEKYKKIAVMGPCANQVFTGGYSGEPYQKISILEGIKTKVGKSSEVLFAQGCKIVNNIEGSYANWQSDKVIFTSHEENLKLIDEAVAVAKQSDVIILALGETEHLCREAWSKNHLGDAQTLDLFGDQEALVKAMVALGKPIIVYLMNGRPLSINYIAKNVPAIIEGWYMGQETGTAAADILFGDVNPSGKLTITIPKSVGQLPLYYNHKPSAQFHDYVSQDVLPLYPFGFGLSYTTFTYSNLRLSSDKISTEQSVEVSVDVINNGNVSGDEIVQLYISDKVASVTRPVLELKGFDRINLKVGETKTVKFIIDKSKLAFWDYNMKYTVEPGEFDIIVGKSSTDFIKKTLTVL